MVKLPEKQGKRYHGAARIFNIGNPLERLSNLRDELESYNKVVDFEVLHEDLKDALRYSDGFKGGRPPCDPVIMFKILSDPNTK